MYGIYTGDCEKAHMWYLSWKGKCSRVANPIDMNLHVKRINDSLNTEVTNLFNIRDVLLMFVTHNKVDELRKHIKSK